MDCANLPVPPRMAMARSKCIAHIKHGVYVDVNKALNRAQNIACTVAAMARVIDEVLRRARVRQMTKADLARAVGISPQRLTNWIARDLPPSSYVNVAEALGCSVDELLGRPTMVLTAIEQQLVTLYRGCAPEHQDDLLAMAQRWHNHMNDQASPANPFGKKKVRA